MDVETCAIPGVVIVRPRVFRDERGTFYESFQRDRYAAAGIAGEFTQDNRSASMARVLRGLHYQVSAPQGHLVTVTRGRIWDVGLDLRPTSPAFGRWVGTELSADPPVQIYLPPGVAHGFCVLSDAAELWYRCVGTYRPDDEGGVLWNDPDLAITWPLRDPIVSDKDARYPRLRDLPRQRLPKV
ncbi:MAG: dTDP-4-dehydrorhamnose 3,5-epimerase [Alphaproteobacteria bacterium]|nr:dTDP-4-dehydrorhamnose 3,5-epimerase [Alphaproteobacteria bacterium]